MLNDPENVECGLQEEPENRNFTDLQNSSWRAVETEYVISADTLVESYFDFYMKFLKNEDFNL